MWLKRPKLATLTLPPREQKRSSSSSSSKVTIIISIIWSQRMGEKRYKKSDVMPSRLDGIYKKK